VEEEEEEERENENDIIYAFSWTQGSSVFWVMTSCSLAGGYHCFGETAASMLRVCNHLPAYTVLWTQKSVINLDVFQVICLKFTAIWFPCQLLRRCCLMLLECWIWMPWGSVCKHQTSFLAAQTSLLLREVEWWMFLDLIFVPDSEYTMSATKICYVYCQWGICFSRISWRRKT
jgi:hypothetical protein